MAWKFNPFTDELDYSEDLPQGLAVTDSPTFVTVDIDYLTLGGDIAFQILPSVGGLASQTSLVVGVTTVPTPGNLYENVLIGAEVADAITSNLYSCVGIGPQVFRNAGDTGSCVAIGLAAMASGSGYGNVAVGSFAGLVTSGGCNVYLGEYAGCGIQGLDQYNTFVGYATFFGLYGSSNNVSNCIAIGIGAGPSTDAAYDKQLFIDVEENDYPEIWGDFGNHYVRLVRNAAEDDHHHKFSRTGYECDGVVQCNNLTSGTYQVTEPHPVGSVYFNTTGVNPATELGYGTWVQVAQGQFLVGAA